MGLYAYEEDGQVVIERTVSNKPSVPDHWTPIVEADLPPRKYRDHWIIVDGAVIVNPDSIEGADHEERARERRLRFDTELPVADQLDIIFKQFDALQQAGIEMLPKTKAMIRARKQIEDDLPLSKG